MAKYETMLITTATLDEETATTLVAKFKSLIEANGTIDSVDDWGKRRLAYPINDETDGVYTLINFTSNTDFPAELDRVYKITDGVLRSMIIAKEEPKAKKVKATTEAK
ncbi:MAG: 30S ribosomal protein S6 [Ruthenibacterium sp.]